MGKENRRDSRHDPLCNGNKNDVQQKKVFSISMRFIAAASVVLFLGSIFGGSRIVRLFAEETSEVYRINGDRSNTIFPQQVHHCAVEQKRCDGCCKLAYHFGGAVKATLPYYGPFPFWLCKRPQTDLLFFHTASCSAV